MKQIKQILWLGQQEYRNIRNNLLIQILINVISQPEKCSCIITLLLLHNYTVLWSKSSHLLLPSLSDPGDYGQKWDNTNSLYKGLTTTLSLAPKTIVHLTACNCKTSCVSLRCKCRKSGLNCCELYRSDDCQNDEEDKFVKVVDQDSEEDYEY